MPFYSTVRGRPCGAIFLADEVTALIKTLTPILPGAQFSVAKDNFCDFDNAAIYMDGQPVTIQQVAHVY